MRKKYKYRPLLPSRNELLFSSSAQSSSLQDTHSNNFSFSSNPKNQHAFQADFHPQGPDQPRRLLRCHVNDLRSIPSEARVEALQALQAPQHLPSTFSAIKPTMSSQKQRNLVPSQTSGPPLDSRCAHPTTTQPQHASFGPPSSDSSPTHTMAHCILSGPSTAAELRRIFHGPPSPRFSTVSRYRHIYVPPTTTTCFSSPSSVLSTPGRLACQSEPGFERDWPVPDDEVHYC